MVMTNILQNISMVLLRKCNWEEAQNGVKKTKFAARFGGQLGKASGLGSVQPSQTSGAYKGPDIFGVYFYL